MVLTQRIEFDVFDENDLAGFGLEERIVDYFVQALPVARSQKFECTCSAVRCPEQAFAVRILTNRLEQVKERLFHAGDAGGAAARNLADAAFSSLQFSLGFRISVPHWIKLA